MIASENEFFPAAAVKAASFSSGVAAPATGCESSGDWFGASLELWPVLP